MLSLEEAIKHCLEVAEANEKMIEYDLAYTDEQKEECRECASEHRQLAKWLKELKAYKDARVGCEYCKHKYRQQHERPCSLCKRNFVDMFEIEEDGE